jgi:acyl-CoA synthetase (AMP-forming)/AMP-acid ligase II
LFLSRVNFWDLDTAPPDATALCVAQSGQSISYAALKARRDDILSRFGAGRGLCRLEAEPTVDFVAAYLAALKARCPVLLAQPSEPGTPQDDGLPCLYRMDAHSGQILTDPAQAGYALHPDLRLLLSTSGSTGARKFVRLSAENICANSTAIAQYLSIGPGDRAPTSLPLSYSYGLSILHSHLQAGASLLLVDEPVISTAFWDAFDEFDCTSFAGVPNSFRMLERSGQLSRDRPGLRYVTQAGGKLDPDEVTRWAATSQRGNWDFFVMYGQTEASPRIAYLPPDRAAQNPASIGVAIPGGRLSVCAPDGALLDPGQEGELVYEGPNVMMGYATDAEDLAKGSGPQRLKTGDLGYQDAAGLFYITGRAARFLKVSGKRVSLDAVEQWLRQQGVGSIATGQDDALALLHTGPEGVARRVAQWLSVPSGFVTELPVATLPTTENGKADLKKAQALLDQHSAQQEDQQTPAAFPDGTGPERIAAIFRRQFPGTPITQETTFDTLGGSSNDFVELEMALEDAGIPPFEDWQFYPIRALAEKLPTKSRSRGWFAPDHGAARALCCICVVLLHVIGQQGKGGGLDLPDTSRWHALNAALEPLRMPLFVLLSGYAFRVMKGHTRRFPEHLSTLFFRVLAPTLFAIAVFAVTSNFLGNRFSLDGPGQYLQLLYLPYAHFWFVMALCLMLTATYLVRRHLPAVSGYVLAALAVGLLFSPHGFKPNVWAINQFIILMPFFICGYFYAAGANWLHARMPAVIVLALSVAVASQFIDPAFGPAQEISGFLQSLSYIVLCVAFAQLLPFASVIAPYTFFIYLWHVFGTAGTRRLLDALGVESVPLMVLAGVVAGLLLPIALFHLLGRLPGSAYLRGK